MKRTLPVVFRSLFFGLALLFTSASSFATHVVGGDIYYTHLGGLTYRITVVLYGDCGSTSGVFPSLYTLTSAPEVCIFDGATLLPGMPITLPYDTTASTRFGTEITPVCPDSLAKTQCTNPSFVIPGIKKFIYQRTYTLPYTSANWKFVFNGNYGGSSAGRATTITNIPSAAGGGSTMVLTATLNNTIYTNSSPNLTVVPTPFFCLNTPICYTPGAIDPDGDSLRFDLVPATEAAGGCTPGTPASYTPAPPYAYGTTPISATTPLRCATGSYSFNTTNGQVCFDPNFTQRAIVVYNVSEYRGGLMVGSIQREMTFLVRGCAVLPPTSDTGIVGPPGPPVLIRDNATSFHVCGNAGNFTLTLNPRPDAGPVPPLTLTASVTGLPTGLTATFTNNGTSTPTVLLSGDAAAMGPGVFTFFLKLVDNACPLNGNKTIAYTISIYPVPHLESATTTPIQCLLGAIITSTPSAQGSPWTIKVRNVALPIPTDTIKTHASVLGPVLDTLGPGIYEVVIYTNVTTQCGMSRFDTVVAPVRMTPEIATSDPTYCGKNDGAIYITNLNPGGIDTITYDKNGIAQTPIVAVVPPSGALVIPNLRAGLYTNIIVHYGYCTSLPLAAPALVDPPFTLRATTYQDATKCGFCDGWIKLHGLHPDQLDTVTFSKDGAPQGGVAFYVTGDSTIKLPGLCKALYTTFTVKTAGVCSATLLNVIDLQHPPIIIAFDTVIGYGCKGDTVKIINSSTPLSELTFKWDFGDGASASGPTPTHVYTNTVGAAYKIKLTGTNSKCIEYDSATFNTDHFVKAGFDMTPKDFVCQIDPVNFKNTSTGTPVLDYMWYFGDGQGGVTTDIAHTYANMATYSPMLVAHHNVFGTNCFDTIRRSIIVDSNTKLTLRVSGDVTAICRGQAVTVSADYSPSGETGNKWTMSDGFAMVDVNPLMHSFDGLGDVTAGFKANFRACPEKTASLSMHVFDVPGIYLGADTAICPGSNPILLADARNYGNPAARWRWNVDENNKSSMLSVNKPGMYAATVTIDGCSTSDTVYVKKDCYVDVPNVFTPNGDGVNDYFFPRGILSKGVVKFDMTIYNRWGQEIYKTSKIDGQGWDGTLNGQPQQNGVYVYSIDATFKDGMIEQHKGNVTLLK